MTLTYTGTLALTGSWQLAKLSAKHPDHSTYQPHSLASTALSETFLARGHA